MLSAPHPNRSRVIYVDGNGVYLNRDGSQSAPYATLQEAIAQCLPDTAYSSFSDFQKIGPTIILAPGEYSGAGLDRSVILKGCAPVTISALSGTCEVLVVTDCGLPNLDVTVSGSAAFNGCTEISGALEGRLIARNCAFDGGTITGSVEIWNSLASSEVTVTSTASLFGCNFAAITAGNGVIFNSYTLLATADADNSGIDIYASTVMSTAGPVRLHGCYPRPVFVPTLVGEAEADALNRLAVAGLIAGVRTEAYSAEVTLGDVISCDPVAGALADEGDAVDYVVSLGVDPEA